RRQLAHSARCRHHPRHERQPHLQRERQGGGDQRRRLPRGGLANHRWAQDGGRERLALQVWNACRSLGHDPPLVRSTAPPPSPVPSSMLRHALRRLLWTIPTLVGVTVVTFFFLSFVPDPLGDPALVRELPPSAIENLRRERFLDLPRFFNTKPRDLS